MLVKAGADVKVIMTNAARDFIGPLTLSTLSKNPVVLDFFEDEKQVWNSHVELGLWADVFVIAPASANTLAKMAFGLCDNMLTAVYLSARCPIFVAPAMDLDMWKHPATQKNIQTLKTYGNAVIPVGKGELASGLTGEGRMAEPEEIFQYLQNHFSGSLQQPDKHPADNLLKNKQIMISAGPTFEAIDPVRFIGNRSTGKMGIALAEEAAKRGANVVLVKGPTHLSPFFYANIDVINVESAQEMFEVCTNIFSSCDIGIMAAAVADYTPINVSDKKIKKKPGDMFIALKRTQDILQQLGKNKKEGQVLAGFALETNDEMENAQKKLVKKNLDLIILNSLQDKGAGFAYNTNKITILDRHNKIRKFELKSKQDVACDILDYLTTFFVND